MIRTTRTKYQKRGFTLIEVLVAVTAGSMLLVIAVGLLRQAMLLSNNAKSRSEFAQSNDRLARQFRDDVQQAISAVVSDDGTLKLQKSETESIVYNHVHPAKPAIQRVSLGSATNDTTERYILLDKARCIFTLSNNPDTVRMQIDTALLGESDQWRVELRVASTVNRWNQLNTNGKKSP